MAWRPFLVGLALAAALLWVPALRFMGWLLGSLFHETGHVAFAWFVGCPAFPAISLTGHAAAFHQEQQGAVLLLVGGGLVGLAVQAARSGRLRGLAFGALAAWVPAAFLTPVREVGFLLSGHLGELAFAGVFLWRARTGRAIETEGERPLYAALGAYLVARNALLCFGLAFVPAARDAYRSNGSFGLENDYVRVAGDWLHVPLPVVAVFMLVLSLAVVPLAWAASRPADPDPAPRAGMLLRRERFLPGAPRG
jgi:hypothetical protein